MNPTQIALTFLHWLETKEYVFIALDADKAKDARMTTEELLDAFRMEHPEAHDDWQSGVPPLGINIVLLWGPHESNPMIAKRREGRWWRPEYRDWLTDWESGWYWMPLPLPPEVSK
jgi:hypothetical protein